MITIPGILARHEGKAWLRQNIVSRGKRARLSSGKLAIRRRLVAIPLAALIAATPFSSAPAAAAQAQVPAKITSVTARPGPGVGQITLRWTHNGIRTTGYVLETALTSFSKTDSSMPKQGRRARLMNISARVRSITLSAAQVHSAGAGIGSGNHLYFRFSAVNKVSSGTTTRAYPYLQAVLPKPPAPKAAGTKLRAATFNIRTARATHDKRSWLRRAPEVAAEIVSRNPGVVALQELGPGRADGETGATTGTIRQTSSLESALAKAHAGRYRLVRKTPYVKPGSPSGTQGARILYDTSRYTLLTRCPETTHRRQYSSSCTIQLPLLATDGEAAKRKAAVAEFRDRRTGKRFFFVSAHLDARHSSSAARERVFDSLRRSQARAIVSRLDKLNRSQEPVVVGGDFNSWQNNVVGNSPHDTLVGQGFYDTSAALTRVNFQYATINKFKTTMPAANPAIGVGVRIDMLFVKGTRGASRFENVMKVTDTTRPSDHNMILSDIVL